MPLHKVRQGEHVSRLAKEHGLASYLTIWNHPQNHELKSQRGNPNVLYPGDELFIPELDIQSRNAVTEKTHAYKLKGKPLRLRLVVQDQTGQPLPNQEAILLMDGRMSKVQSDAEGLIDEPISPSVEQASLSFQGQDLVFPERLELRVGHLDPVDTENGWVARLNNLGYRAGLTDTLQPDGSTDPETKKMRKSAVEEFQCDHDLTVDGICGPKTQAKIKEIHGC